MGWINMKQFLWLMPILLLSCSGPVSSVDSGDMSESATATTDQSALSTTTESSSFSTLSSASLIPAERAHFELTKCCNYVKEHRPYDYFNIDLYEDYSASITLRFSGEEETQYRLSYYCVENEEVGYFLCDCIHFAGEDSSGLISLIWDHCYYSRGGETIRTQSQGVTPPSEVDGSSEYVTATFTRMSVA